MKTLVLSMISIAATVAAMTACTSESDPINEITNPKDAKVEIKLNAGVIGVETKAAITGDDTFEATIVGWESADKPTAEAELAWQTTAKNISGKASNEVLKLEQTQYYNPNGTKTYIRGFYPTATPNGTSITFTNETGSVDLIMSDLTDVGTKAATLPVNIPFSHKLSQLKMNIKKDASLGDDVTLKSITVKNAVVPTGFDLITGTINYSEPTDISISNISDASINNTDGSIVGDPIMIKPITETNAITLDIVTSQGTFSGIAVNLDDTDTDGGTSYNIDLTFKKKDVSTTASVTDWTSGTGSGDVF